MAELYPLFLNLTGRLCVVAGGGAVAARKVTGLLAAGARVAVIAPQVVTTLQEAAARGDVDWRPRAFEPNDLDGAILAFMATSSRDVNRQGAREAQARGVWANVSDDPESCDFLVPAAARRGEVRIAVSTGGASPATAAWLRDRIAASLPEGIETLVEVSRALRARAGGGDRGRAFRELFASGILDDLAAGDWDAADRKVARCFETAPGVRELLERPRREAT